MKFFGLLFLMISMPVLSAPCKVYGISDSPQKLDCSFEKELKIQLNCSHGHYLLGGAPVSNAFHLEVETGSSPLVFKTAKSTLTLVKEKSFFTAELETSEGTLTGSCL